MHGYEVYVRVDPPHIFGLPEEGYSVLPPGTVPVFKFDAEQGTVWADRPDGGEPHRNPEERFRMETQVDDLALAADDNVFRVVLRAQDADQAVALAKDAIRRLFVLRSALDDTPHRIDLTALEVWEDDARVQTPVQLRTKVYLYDLESLRVQLERSAALLRGLVRDRRLGQALRYFALGDDLGHITPQRPPDDYLDEMAPLRFLQYWKALATIVGDPSGDKDHQSRHQRLGLPRQFFRHEVKPLHELRDRFGVAHVADPDAPRIVSMSDMTRCRAAASRAIQAYAASKGAKATNLSAE